jgi:UDP-2,3-diacylglucosamine pyrophosphatase LpxH
MTGSVDALTAGPPSRRAVELVVVSDVHLGTRSCKAEQLDRYLAGLEPGEVVLNGDIVDLRETHKGYWPASHAAVLRRLMAFAEAGVPVHYVTGNHDEALRRFTPFTAGAFRMVDAFERMLDGRRTWFVHGDAIEGGMPVNRLVRRVGCTLYHSVRALERWICRMGVGSPELVAALKRTRQATAHIERYEQACVAAAATRGFDAVVTGHIHAASMREFVQNGRCVRYLNSGDWVDSLTALEWHAGAWRLVRFGDVEESEVEEVEAREAVA